MQKRRKILNNQGFGLMSVVIAIGVIATVVVLSFILNRTDFILFQTAFGAIVGGLVVFAVQKFDLNNINERKQKRSLKAINSYLVRILSRSDAILAESFCFKKQCEVIEEAYPDLRYKDSSSWQDRTFLFGKIMLENFMPRYKDLWEEEKKKENLDEHPFKQTNEERTDPLSGFLHQGALSLNITSDTINNIQNLEKKDSKDVMLLINYVLLVIQKINAIDAVFKEVNILMRAIDNRWMLPPDEAAVGFKEFRNIKSLSILLYDDIREIFGYSYLAREKIQNLYRLYKFDINEVSIQDEKGLIKKFKFISEELSKEGQPLISL